MKRVKIFALVEGKLIDKLSDRVSGTWIRIHYILNHLKQRKDIELAYIPFEYKHKFSPNHSRLSQLIDLCYHLVIPILSCLILLFRRPDFVYFSYPNVIYNDRLNVPLLRLAKRVGIKLLMYSHDWVEQRQMLGKSQREIQFFERLEKELVAKSDILVVTATKYPDYETALIPAGFEAREFASLRYEICEKRFNIGYAGAIMPHHSISLLVNSAIRLHQKYPFIKLLLFGEIALLDEDTRRKIAEKDFINHRIIPRSKLIPHFAEVDVFAYLPNPHIPYLYQARTTKFFEYLGSEIPFIATRCGGLKLVSDGKGFLWVDYSEADVCRKLEYLLKHPKERLRLSRELHELKGEHTWQKRADRLHDVIAKHINREERRHDVKQTCVS